MAKPELLRIVCEPGYFDCLGRLADGSQFMAFAWPPFEFHRFDAAGNHLETRIAPLAFEVRPEKIVGQRADPRLRANLDELIGNQQFTLCDIWVRLFAVEIDGEVYGLFYENTGGKNGSGYEDEPGFEYVHFEPGNIVFHPPWDSGAFST